MARLNINGKLHEVLDGVKTLLSVREESARNNPLIVLQFIVFRHNEHQMESMRSLAAELGVDRLEFKSAQIYGFEMGSPMIPENELYSRYSRNPDGGYAIKNRLPNRCWRMWSGTVITWDGRVVPCCFDKDATHVLGDLNKENVRAVWNSEKYRDFRSRLSEARSKIDICTNCSEGVKVFS